MTVSRVPAEAPAADHAGVPPSDPAPVQLGSDPQAAGDARRAVRETLSGWRLPDLVDTVVLAVSELVTNAVRHGRPPVLLQLRHRPPLLRVEVHDGSPTEPPDDPPGTLPDDESGRGLGIVQELADDVVVEQVTDDGKIVHALFHVDPDPEAHAPVDPAPTPGVTSG